MLTKNPGFLFTLYVEGKDKEGKRYIWDYYVYERGAYERMFNNFKAWNVKFDKQRPGYYHQGPTTYSEWLKGIYGGNPSKGRLWPLIGTVNQWVDFKVNLKDSFKVEGAPAIPEEITLTKIKLGEYIWNTTAWRLDEVSLEIKGEE